MDVDAVIKEEINRISTFGANLDNKFACVGKVANHILERITDIGLPNRAEQIVEKCFLEGWLQNQFYYFAIAELVNINAFVYENGIVSKGAKFEEALTLPNKMYEARQLEELAKIEKINQAYEEGIMYVKDKFIPVELHGLLANSFSGCHINKANFVKRVIPGAIVDIEFGKRHARFISTISGNNEYTSFYRYIRGKVVKLKKSKVVVEIRRKIYEVDSWRIASVQR